MPFDQPRHVELTAEERADLRTEAIRELVVCAGEVERALDQPGGERHHVDRIGRLVVALTAIGPSIQDAGPTTVEGNGALTCLGDIAAGMLEQAWFQQNAVEWIWWAALAEKLGEDVDAEMPPQDPGNDEFRTPPPEPD